MPSTGTASFTVTRDQLIEDSLRMIKVIQETDAANATQIRIASQALNMLLKNMQSNGLPLWCYQLITIPMVVGQESYTIGPVGADVTTTRPLRLFDGSFIRDITNSTPACQNDTPLRLISRLEYLQYGSKATQAIPNSIYWQPWIDDSGGTTSPSTGYGTLFVYTTSSTTQRTIYANFQRPIYDMTSGDDEFDLPSEWFRCLKYMLAGDLAYDFPNADRDLAKEIRELGRAFQNELQDWSTETAAVTFQPDQTSYRSGWRG